MTASKAGGGPPVSNDSFWERLQQSSDFPLVALLCVTERCPMACAHCYQLRDDLHEQDPELSLEEIGRVLDELAELGALRLTITGGEPTMRRDLRQIVAAAWQRKFLIGLKTTAAFLKPDDIDGLRADGLTVMSVSLYHVDAAKHDQFVGHPGAFARSTAALERFGALGGQATISTVIMDWNADAIGPLKELCAQRGWSFVADAKVLSSDDGGARPAKQRAHGAAQVDAMRHLPNARQRHAPRRADDAPCLAGVSSLYIKPNGDVWACPALPITLGNVREAPLAQIWRGSPALKQIQGLTWGASEPCMTCARNRFCQRCPGEAHKEHGDPTRAATVDCTVAQAFERIWAADGDEEQT